MERFGITYNDRGEITGSTPWSPQTMGPTEVAATPYAAYQSPVSYATPAGAIGGGRSVAQPYNTSSMYDFMPRYAAEGGIMEVEPVHMAIGGALSTANRMVGRAMAPAIMQAVQQQQAAQQAAAAQAVPVAMQGPQPSAPAPQQYASQPSAPAPQQYVPPPSAPMQQYTASPAQISDLARRMYPSLYDEEYKKRIMGNMSGGSGIASLASGGYPRRTGQISGPGTGTSDSIPAMLSDGEFVMTAKAVRGAGKGSRLAGAKKMYALMHQLERNAARG
jgi:hypothetical protein